MLPAAVAAGHPATVAAGIEILEDGGTAADAAVAACLASCVAETVMTGLLGGGHAIYWDGRQAWNLDCFVTVPAETGADVVDLAVPFGEEVVHYAVGPGTCGVPGLPAGLGALSERFGRLPWRRLVEPAIRARADGRADAARPRGVPGDARARLHANARGPRDLRPGRLPARERRRARPAGLAGAMEILAAEGPRSAYCGSIAEALLDVDGIALTPRRPRVVRARLAGARHGDVRRDAASTRAAGLAGVAETLGRLPRLRGPRRHRARARACWQLDDGGGVDGHTTNLDGRRRRRLRLRPHDEPRASAPATSCPATTCT